MKIFFIGSVEFSKKMLLKLVEMKCDIVGVAAGKNNSFNSDYFDLSTICSESKIPCKSCDSINSVEMIDWIRRLSPDVIFCMGWSALLKKDLLSIPSLGVIGYHPAELPKNRGRHPLIWAVFLGITRTASTFFIMNEGADGGDIVSQEFINIDYKDDAAKIYENITIAASRQIEKLIFDLQNNCLVRVPQNSSLSNVWRKRNVEDGKIDFRMNSFAIYNLVRALSRPYCGAHIVYKGSSVKVWKVNEIKCCDGNLEPGKVIRSGQKSFVVKTYDGAVEIIEHDFKTIPKLGEYL